MKKQTVNKSSSVARQEEPTDVGATAETKDRLMSRPTNKNRKYKAANAKAKSEAAAEDNSESATNPPTGHLSAIPEVPLDPQSGIIKKLTTAYAAWEESAKRHETELETIANVTDFLDTLGDSVTFGGADFDIFDRGWGYLAWLQGMALWQVLPLVGLRLAPLAVRPEVDPCRCHCEKPRSAAPPFAVLSTPSAEPPRPEKSRGLERCGCVTGGVNPHRRTRHR